MGIDAGSMTTDPSPSHPPMTHDELVAHILDQHKMGNGDAAVQTDPLLADLWTQISTDPSTFHDEDHRAFGPGHDHEWN